MTAYKGQTELEGEMRWSQNDKHPNGAGVLLTYITRGCWRGGAAHMGGCMHQVRAQRRVSVAATQ